MADPTPFVPGYSYTDYQETAPADPLPGPQVDNDFADVATSTVTLVNAVKDIRRSDGRLKNASVSYDTLNDQLKAMLLGIPSGAVQYVPILLSPEVYGAKGDGLADDTAAFLAGWADGKIMALRNGATYCVENLAAGDGCFVWCPPGSATIRCLNAGGKTVIMQGGALFDGPIFDGDPEYHFYHDPAVVALSSVIFRNCTIVGGGIGHYFFGGSTGVNTRGARRCRFENVFWDAVANPFVAETMADFFFDKACRWEGYTGAAVLAYSAQRCHIQGTIRGAGVTGVTFLGRRSLTGFFNGCFEDNTIDVEGDSTLEEFVSFDVNGGSGAEADCLACERALVSAKSSDAAHRYITLAGTWTGATGVFGNSNDGNLGIGAYLCLADGEASGGTYRIFSNTNGVFAFRRPVDADTEGDMSDDAFDAIATGDFAVVGLPFRNNTVKVRFNGAPGANDYTAAVMLYGMCFGNVVTGKAHMKRNGGAAVSRAVGVYSLNAISGAGSFVSSGGDGRAAPSGYNLVVDFQSIGCDVEIAYYDFGAALTPYRSYGNRIANGTISAGKALISDQDVDVPLNTWTTP